MNVKVCTVFYSTSPSFKMNIKNRELLEFYYVKGNNVQGGYFRSNGVSLKTDSSQFFWTRKDLRDVTHVVKIGHL